MTAKRPVTDGTAEDESGDGDYIAGQETVQFAGTAGEVETVVVQIVADDRPERDEDFSVDFSSVLAGGRDVALSSSTATGSILDDDDLPFFADGFESGDVSGWSAASN